MAYYPPCFRPRLLFARRSSCAVAFPLVAESLMHRYPALLGMGRPILWQDWFFSLIWLLLGLIYTINWYFIRKTQPLIKVH